MVCIVEIVYDSVSKQADSMEVLVYQFVHTVERQEFMLDIAHLIIASHIPVTLPGWLSAVQIVEVQFIAILLGLLPEDGIPVANLVKSAIEIILLTQAIRTVLCGYHLLISDLNLENT